MQLSMLAAMTMHVMVSSEKSSSNAITAEMLLPAYYKLFYPLGPLPAYLKSPIQDDYAIFTTNKYVFFFR